MTSPAAIRPARSQTAPALSIEGLTVGYGGVPAGRELHAQVRPGEILALLGPNGAGKATTPLASVGALLLIRRRTAACAVPAARSSS
ncbi:hypothetical protein [Nocardia sputorum]|uniref:ATP-binding cassette domain-containing protein n=1 Tax=Nocardia sputorum TaxID=2984338 RepID=A0ABM8CYQ5_9NOCA|nr:hypothetical protein IFM12276_31810 [Nocardia sputorum]